MSNNRLRLTDFDRFSNVYGVCMQKAQNDTVTLNGIVAELMLGALDWATHLYNVVVRIT